MNTRKIKSAIAAASAALVLFAASSPAAGALPPRALGLNQGPGAIAPIAPTDGVSTRNNDGRFKKSGEAKRQLCHDLKSILEVNEAEADKRAGTKAAKPYAKNADKAWNDASKQGCRWAQ
jgi:hypothetical protein